MINLLLHWIAYMATVFIALSLGKLLLRNAALVIESERLRFLLCLGVPLFAFTTCLNWLFPSRISLAEHVFDNLALALVASLTWEAASSSSRDNSLRRK